MGRHVGAPSDGHQHGGRSGVYLGYFKAFLLSAELSHIGIDAFYYMLADQTSKKHKASRCFHVRDMFRAAILLSRTAQKSKIQTALFSKQKQASKQADGNLYFLLCDEDKNPKLCLVMNFSFFMTSCENQDIFQRDI